MNGTCMVRDPWDGLVVYMPEEWREVQQYVTYCAHVRVLESMHVSVRMTLRCSDSCWWGLDVWRLPEGSAPVINMGDHYDYPAEEYAHTRAVWSTMCVYSTEPLV